MMETINFDREDLKNLFIQITGYAIDTKDRKLAESANNIRDLLFDGDYKEELDSFDEASKNEGYEFIIE